MSHTDYNCNFRRISASMARKLSTGNDSKNTKSSGFVTVEFESRRNRQNDFELVESVEIESSVEFVARRIVKGFSILIQLSES